MSRYTAAELATQEEFDAQAHENLRSLHEHLLLRTVERAKAGEDVAESVRILLESFQNTSLSVQRLVGRVRRLEAEAPSAPAQSASA